MILGRRTSFVPFQTFHHNFHDELNLELAVRPTEGMSHTQPSCEQNSNTTMTPTALPTEEVVPPEDRGPLKS